MPDLSRYIFLNVCIYKIKRSFELYPIIPVQLFELSGIAQVVPDLCLHGMFKVRVQIGVGRFATFVMGLGHSDDIVDSFYLKYFELQSKITRSR
ncbi:hypothetical protein GCM10028818_50300 [Spirosoma horti]